MPKTAASGEVSGAGISRITDQVWNEIIKRQQNSRRREGR